LGWAFISDRGKNKKKRKEKKKLDRIEVRKSIHQKKEMGIKKKKTREKKTGPTGDP